VTTVVTVDDGLDVVVLDDVATPWVETFVDLSIAKVAATKRARIIRTTSNDGW
jgi:hypothetical protein